MADLPITTMGERLRWLRSCALKTGMDVSRATGLPPETISRLERDRVETLPAIHTVDVLARFYGVTVDWIVYGRGDEPDPECVREEVAR